MLVPAQGPVKARVMVAERARGSLPPHHLRLLALSHPGLATAIAEVAELFGYCLV